MGLCCSRQRCFLKMGLANWPCLSSEGLSLESLAKEIPRGPGTIHRHGGRAGDRCPWCKASTWDQKREVCRAGVRYEAILRFRAMGTNNKDGVTIAKGHSKSCCKIAAMHKDVRDYHCGAG